MIELPPPPANAQFEINKVTTTCERKIRHKLENPGIDSNNKNDLWDKIKNQLNEYNTAIENERPAFVLTSSSMYHRSNLLVDVLRNIPTVNHNETYDSIRVTTMKIVSSFYFHFCEFDYLSSIWVLT